VCGIPVVFSQGFKYNFIDILSIIIMGRIYAVWYFEDGRHGSHIGNVTDLVLI